MAALLLAIPSPTRAWSRMGHEIVAELASRELSDSTRAEVRALLGGRGMPSAAAWADEIRAKRPTTRPWHFVNIPLGASAYFPARDCAGETCIVAALERQIVILRDRSRSRTARAEALRFVIHLVGDIHQPLHCADNGDKGGNAIAVRWFGRKSTLHQVWDSDILTRPGASAPQIASELQRVALQSPERGTFLGGTPADWANESHRIAVELAYRIPADGELGEAYYDPALVVASVQLARAGARLARVLNEALGTPSVTPTPIFGDPYAIPTQACVPREQCCKICSAGQACGATCISRSYTCRVGRGCACQDVEVCR